MFNKKIGQAILVCEECSRKIAKIKIVKIFEAKNILDVNKLKLNTDENEKYPFKEEAEYSN